MSKKLIGVTTLAAVILALMLILAVLMSGFQRRYQAERAILEFQARLSEMREPVRHRHRMLAKWYNFCLSANTSQTDCREAYQEIWNVSNGMMGYLELPQGNIRVPIYHNAALPEDTLAAGHVPGSPFPVGGKGNHTVLLVPQEAAKFTEGEIFCVHIPGDVLYYSVREVKMVSPGQTGGLLPEEGEDLCTLSAAVRKGAEIQKVLVHGVRCEGKTEVRVAAQDGGLVQRVIIWTLGGLLFPFAAGGAGWIARWGCRKLCCKRLTKKSG